MIHSFRQPKSLTPWLTLCVVVAGFAGCGGSTDVDMGQSPGAGGSASAGGSLSFGGSASNPNPPSAGGPNASPCGPTPCADHTGDKTFVESDTPANAPDQFEAATPHEPGTDDSRQPAIVYPSHETMFPINVSHIRHDWTAGKNDLFELRFVGPKTTVTVYTTSATWTPSDEQWDWIAESNRGAAVELTVSGLDQARPADSWLSEPNTSFFSESAVEGAIYYWSTGTKGIMRATVGSPLPEKFYTDPSGSDSESCAACHTLSRDGKRLAVGYNGERLREVSVPERATIVPVGGDDAETAPEPAPKPEPGMPMPGMPMPAMPKPPKGMMGEGMAAAWTTFSPDGEMLLVAANGVLTLIDSDTGEPIGDNGGVVGIPSGTVATHPDWAATGDKVAIALGTKGGNKEIEAGSIAILPYANGAWGEAEVIVASSGDKDNNFFPVWSPDSKWLAYVHAEGKSRDAASAELRLLDMSSRKDVSLVRVNQRVSNVDGVMGVGNSMPTWAPSTQPGTFWLAFSSVRAYSVVRPLDDKADQIWIAAIEPSAKGDPSFSAFWAPFQSIAEGNHRAFWTHASDDTQCRCVDVCGDSLDNDCDGTADEAGCSECGAEEICGDGIDNDCDCVVDDCNAEICNDGIDNDGDGNIDSADPQCQVK